MSLCEAGHVPRTIAVMPAFGIPRFDCLADRMVFLSSLYGGTGP
jgi:hypothetical protein